MKAVDPKGAPESERPAENAEQVDSAEELQRLRDQMLHLQADFENARRRWRKEQAEIQEQAYGDLLRQLLEITDDFERALQASQESSGVSDTFRKGVEMIARRLEGFLRSYGVEPIEAVGKPFDPGRHEAVAHEATDSVPESTVVSELRKGYLMNGRVLRPAVVRVSVKPLGSDPQEQKGV